MVRTKKKVNEKLKKKDNKITLQKKEIEEAMKDIDPRRRAFGVAYLDPDSPTYADVKNSALRAGFEYSYAHNLTALKPDWLYVVIGHHNFLDKARANLKKNLELNTKVPVMTPFGPYVNKKTKKMMVVEDPKLLKIQQDATIFVLDRIDRNFKKKKEDTDLTPVAINNIIILPSNGKTREEAISDYKEIEQ